MTEEIIRLALGGICSLAVICHWLLAEFAPKVTLYLPCAEVLVSDNAFGVPDNAHRRIRQRFPGARQRFPGARQRASSYPTALDRCPTTLSKCPTSLDKYHSERNFATQAKFLSE